MISCPKCGKENQDHYKFCLGCGNELPREAGAARPFHPTPPAGVPAAAPAGPGANPFAGPSAAAAKPMGAAPVAAPAANPFAAQPAAAPSANPFAAPVAQPAPIAAPVAPPAPTAPAAALPANCPQCGTPNPRAQRFCMTCGFDNASAPPAAAAPVAAPAAAPMAAPVAAPAPMAPAPAAGAQASRARLVLIRPDGTEGGMYQLPEGAGLVGRDTGGVFQGDSYLSPRHATFTINGQTASVRDENSLNGIYLRIERQTPTEIRDGEVFRIGQEILRFDAFRPSQPEADGTEKQGAQLDGLIGRISLQIGRETTGNAFPVPVAGLYLGRERGDILFPEDGYVSGLHCQLTVEGGRLMLTDVGSSNGTYVRLGRGDRILKNNDLLLLGQQLFRLTFA